MAFKTPNGTYRHTWRQNGRRLSRTFPNKALAQKFIAELKLGMHADEGTSRSKITFAEFAKTWLEDFCKVEKAESQWGDCKRVIEQHLVPSFGHVRLAELRKTHLLELKKSLIVNGKTRFGRPLSPRSINIYLGLAKKIMSTAVEWEYLTGNPFQTVKMVKQTKQAFDFWTAEERDRFLRFAKSIDPVFAKVVTVACFTGLRLGEQTALRRGDVDFGKRLIFVGRSYSHKLKKGWDRTKNGEVEYVPMVEEVAEALADLQLSSSDRPVFETKMMRYAYYRLRGLCIEAGVRAIRWHDLRHTFASCLVMAGVDLYTVQKLMRHKTVAMTQRYAHLAPSYLRGEIHKISSHAGRPSQQSLAAQGFESGGTDLAPIRTLRREGARADASK